MGWGETPLKQWVWPGSLTCEPATCAIARAWPAAGQPGHPLEIGHRFITGRLPELLAEANRTRPADAAIPWLAALVCASAFDLATQRLRQLMGCADDATYGHRSPGMRSGGVRSSDPAFAGRYPATTWRIESDTGFRARG